MTNVVSSLFKHCNRFYKPNNLAPRYQYNELPCQYINNIIKHKLENPKKIPSIICGQEYNLISRTKDENIIKHYSPLNTSKVCYKSLYVDNLDDKIDFDKINRARIYWNKIGLNKRIEIFESIATQISSNRNGYKDELLTDTMVGQGKSLYEAEIDSICELIDFLKFNNFYASEIQIRANSLISDEYEFNYSEINGLNGFITSITPFNFTAIAANLVSAPLLMGSPVIWKPSEYSLLSNYTYMKILLDNNIPPELISFIPSEPNYFLDYISNQKEMAGIIFTGSSQVFDNIYSKIGSKMNQNIYNNYPRLIGETGGKNYHFVHPSADINKVVDQTFHSAFGYNGQKCSACSRLYLPNYMLNDFINKIKELINERKNINYASYSLINKKSFSKTINELISLENDSDVEILLGNYDLNNKIIEPTIIKSNNYKHDIFNKEYFAPILAIYTYSGTSELDEVINICINSGDNYALTGAIFANDREFIQKCYNELRFTAGNFYINAKSTGAVVGRQPFGGLGKSGTNDKAGDINLLYRLMNQRSIKVGF